MNIHFDNNEYFEILKQSTLLKIEVGSKMYGLNDENSDVDYLYILPNSAFDDYTLVQSHHQLQFKEAGIDHNFTSLRNFLSNTIKGDSTINFEVINSESLVGTDLAFLYENRKAFWTYNIIRSYLGLSRRDFKFYFRENTDRDRKKKLSHMFRGYFFAKSILSDNFSLIDEVLLNKIKDVRSTNWSIFNSKDLDVYASEAMGLTSLLRDELNKRLNDKNIIKVMSIDNQVILNNNLKVLFNSHTYVTKKSLLNIENESIKKQIYDANENWVSYE